MSDDNRIPTETVMSDWASGENRILPRLEAFFWWATLGTSCCIVTAVTEDDARILAKDRFRAAGLGQWSGRVSKATPEQWRRFTQTLNQQVEHERRKKEWAE